MSAVAVVRLRQRRHEVACRFIAAREKHRSVTSRTNSFRPPVSASIAQSPDNWST